METALTKTEKSEFAKYEQIIADNLLTGLNMGPLKLMHPKDGSYQRVMLINL